VQDAEQQPGQPEPEALAPEAEERLEIDGLPVLRPRGAPLQFDRG